MWLNPQSDSRLPWAPIICCNGEDPTCAAPTQPFWQLLQEPFDLRITSIAGIIRPRESLETTAMTTTTNYITLNHAFLQFQPQLNLSWTSESSQLSLSLLSSPSSPSLPSLLSSAIRITIHHYHYHHPLGRTQGFPISHTNSRFHINMCIYIIYRV